MGKPWCCPQVPRSFQCTWEKIRESVEKIGEPRDEAIQHIHAFMQNYYIIVYSTRYRKMCVLGFLSSRLDHRWVYYYYWRGWGDYLYMQPSDKFCCSCGTYCNVVFVCLQCYVVVFTGYLLKARRLQTLKSWPRANLHLLYWNFGLHCVLDLHYIDSTNL